MANLPDDLRRFSEQWIANPAAKLEFARLVERAVRVGAGESGAPLLVVVFHWIAEEKRAAASIGVK